MSSLLNRIAVFSARHRALVIGVWLVLLVGLGFASHTAGTKYSSSAEVAGSDSEAANDIMARSFDENLSDASPVVFHTETGTITDAEHQPTVEASLKAVAGDENVESVGQLVVSEDGKTGYATVLPSTALGDLSVAEAEEILETAQAPAEGTDMQVETGGQLGTKISKPENKISEVVGIAVAMLILVLVFGTVTAMVLPIAVAIFGLICGLSLITLLGHVVSVPDVAPTVASMIGLGVGIDYSLFIVTRARSARHDGMTVHDAIGHAASTSGSAVAFAGGTVVIALLSLAVSGVSLITVLGQAAAIVVVVAVLASMTLLPALLGLCGDGIERLRIGRDKRPHLGHSTYWQKWGERLSRRPGVFAVASVVLLLSLAVSGVSLITVLGQAAAIVVIVAVLASMTLLPALLGLCGDGIERLRIGPDKRPHLGHSTYWQKWGERLSRRPGLFAVASVVLLLSLTAPVTNLGLGLTDQSSSPESTTSRQAYDLMTESFGAGSNGALLVTANVDGPEDPTIGKLHDGLVASGDAQSVSEPQLSKDGTAAMINVIPNGSPTSDATSDLVDTTRDEIIPASGADAHVGGSTAQQLDLAALIGERLPLIIGVVVGLSMLLLLIAFRSVVAPIQAAFVNLLSVGAAYGVVTGVFQEGLGATAIGLDGAIPVVSYVPMMLFAILFGLAMDYQVFLLSRVREEIDAGKSPRRAVVDGLAGTGKVIASAAAIMVAVFASFILNGDPTVKEFGVGLAAAILIAGSMVCVLLPAVMLLMGRRTWWLPRWLDRVLPDISIEGQPHPQPA